MRPLVWIFRLALVFAAILPLLFPYVLRSTNKPLQRSVSVLIPYDFEVNADEIQKIRLALAGKMQDQQFQFSYQKFGHNNQSALQRFDELGQLIANQTQLTIVVQKPNLWGSASLKFNAKILETNVAKALVCATIQKSPYVPTVYIPNF